jgi:predicted amidohydrolase
MTLSVGCHQIAFSPTKAENLSRILEILDHTDAYLNVFAEYAMGVPPEGLSKEFVQNNAEPLHGGFVSKILEKTRQKKSSVVFTTFLKEGKAVFNAAILVDEGKIAAVYKKIHLFDAFGHRESEFFHAGSQLAIAEIGEFKVGLAVCFDLRFPELFRSMAYKGVNLFIVPSAWFTGKYKLDQWRTLILARAHENISYLVAVNQAHPLFVGHSIVASPLGYALEEAGEDQASFSAELSEGKIEEANRLVPTLQLSKPELYKKWQSRS